MHHKEHMKACSATISIYGTRGQAQHHVQACSSATISVSGHVVPEEHVQACSSATISVSGHVVHVHACVGACRTLPSVCLANCGANSGIEHMAMVADEAQERA